MNAILLAAAAAPSALPSLAAPKPGAPVLTTNALAPVPALPAPQTTIAAHAAWLTHGLAGLFILSAIVLVFLLAIQTTKQEGLTGSIGGRVESAYRGRLGAEEQLKRLTGITAVIFVVTAFILSLTGI